LGRRRTILVVVTGIVVGRTVVKEMDMSVGLSLIVD